MSGRLLTLSTLCGRRLERVYLSEGITRFDLLKALSAEEPAPTKICEWCAASFTDDHGIGAARFARRHFCSKSCANKARIPKTQIKSGWVIFDKIKRGPYVEASFDSEAQARASLADLLKDYPVNHYWRRRLTIERIGH